MGWKWMKIFEDGDRTMMVGVSFTSSHGLTLQFMVRTGDEAKPYGTLKQALDAFNEKYVGKIMIANTIPQALKNGGMPLKRKPQ
jgi:hypothetical protein